MKKLTNEEAVIELLKGNKLLRYDNLIYSYNKLNNSLSYYNIKDKTNEWSSGGFSDILSFIKNTDFYLYEPKEQEPKEEVTKLAYDYSNNPIGGFTIDSNGNYNYFDIKESKGDFKEVDIKKILQDLQAQQDTIDRLEAELKELEKDYLEAKAENLIFANGNLDSYREKEIADNKINELSEKLWKLEKEVEERVQNHLHEKEQLENDLKEKMSYAKSLEEKIIELEKTSLKRNAQGNVYLNSEQAELIQFDKKAFTFKLLLGDGKSIELL